MNLISVYSTAGKLEAEIIKGFLEAQGLQVILNQESVGQTIGLSAGPLGKVDVLVPESQVTEAKGYINAIANGDYEDYPNQDPSEDI